MPKTAKCLPCISEDLKDIIRAKNKHPALLAKLDEIGTCPDEGTIEFCGRKKRAASAYQVYIKDCLATKPIKGQPFGAAGEFMKECAAQWNAQKGQ